MNTALIDALIDAHFDSFYAQMHQLIGMMPDPRTLAAIHAPPMPDGVATELVAENNLSLLQLQEIQVAHSVGHADALLARLSETETKR